LSVTGFSGPEAGSLPEKHAVTIHAAINAVALILLRWKPALFIALLNLMNRPGFSGKRFA
jgi:hypothetical protein